MAATEKSRSLRQRAMAATATLLGTTGVSLPPAQAADRVPLPASEWSWDTSFMQYSESERITVREPQIGVRRDMAEGKSLSILATVDTISGSTPLGTLPPTINTAPNTVTNASGRAVNPYVGKVPTSEMSDTRVALNATYESPLGPDLSGAAGGNVSREHDFLSAGTSATLNRYWNQKNTVLSVGISPEYDVVSPNGGLPRAYATHLSAQEYEGDRHSKYLLSGLLGLTQVINRRTLMQWNYSPTYENGYLNDPYKLLSIVNNQGDPLSAVHEKRPGSRLQHSFYWLTRYNLRDADVFSLGLRYFKDSWGIHSQTLDFTYRWSYHEQRFLEPHVRYYHQSQADFFQVGLRNGWGLPDFASADYRLNAFDAVTFGITFGWTLANGSRLHIRADYYTQTGEDRPNTAIGAQRAFDLFPSLKATILQIQYTFDPRRLWKKNS